MSDLADAMGAKLGAAAERVAADAAGVTALGTAGSDPVPIVPMRRELVQRIDEVLRLASANLDDDDELVEAVDAIGREVTEALR